jgi:hypothetical protein
LVDNLHFCARDNAIGCVDDGANNRAGDRLRIQPSTHQCQGRGYLRNVSHSQLSLESELIRAISRLCALYRQEMRQPLGKENAHPHIRDPGGKADAAVRHGETSVSRVYGRVVMGVREG